MTERFDIVVAGAGHNSLVAAAYLTKAGLSCLVLEARPRIGGNTATEELTLPGFLHDTCSTAHAIFMERALEPPAERVEIPYSGVQMGALLRLPAGMQRPPVVIMLPGLDSTKEEIQTTADYFLRRGMATLAVDGPGQGETEALLHIEPAYEHASQAIMQWLTSRPNLDHDRVGVFGVSLGGYYSVRTAAFVPGIRAAVDLAGLYSMAEHWDERPPMTRATFTRRSGAADETEGRQRAQAMTLASVTEHVRCPLLIVHGTNDTIVPFSDAERMHAEIPGSELAAFEGSNHGCTDRVFASRSLMADWLAERLG